MRSRRLARIFRTSVGVLAGLAMAPMHAGCNRQPADNGAPGRARVAFVMKTLNHPFFLDMKRGAEEAASTLGVDLVVQAAERELDVEKQTQIIENLIQTGVNALCVTPRPLRQRSSSVRSSGRTTTKGENWPVSSWFR
jgi:ribose transport system substrate-binding protein